MTSAGGFHGRRISLLTQHGKEQLLAPLFAERLGAHLELATGIDTDSFGTFSREVPRAGTQLEAARRKARAGMALLGVDCGVASEGAFGASHGGWLPSNVELVVLIDERRQLELVGRAEGAPHHLHARVSTHEALQAFAQRADFPTHGLILRPDDEDDPRVRKGAIDEAALHAAFEAALAESRTGAVFVESDLRAHRNPTRRDVIRRATEDLLARVASACPRCATPGFWAVERLEGLPCRDCATPTTETRATRWGCVRGDHIELRAVAPALLADPARCPACNP